MNQDQIYQLGVLAFSVAEARRILAAAPRTVHPVSPGKWAANFRLTENDPRIDHQYAMTQTDPNAAVFVVIIETKKKIYSHQASKHHSNFPYG